ncbi:MAG: hypothetical protein MRY76_04320 [Pseudomonadales bacterium]|nr:hypothetical protein [Pseudomonadales bacterium]
MSEVQSQVIRLVQAMFNGAPNASILDELSELLQSPDVSVLQLANWLADNPVFSSEMYASSLSNAEFGAAFIDNIVGSAASQENKDWAAAEAAKFLDAGMPRGQLISQVADALFETGASNPDWGEAATQFRNKVEVASSYAITNQGAGGTLDTLQAVTSSVSADPDSVTAAISAFSEAWTGVVVDGYVAGATVFVDLDGDGVQGPSEPSTTTDAMGNFSFAGGENNWGPIIAVGGTDIATGKPFKGSLTASPGSTVVNPLTTLIDKLSMAPGTTVSSARAKILTALGLDPSTNLQDFDPIATAANPAATDEQKALALKVQAAAAKVNTFVEQTSALLQGSGVSGDSNASTGAAYQALADALSVAASSAGLSTDPNDPDAPVSDGTLDLSSGTAIANIVKSAATKAGASSTQQSTVDGMADDASSIITNLNNAISNALGDGSGDVTETLNGMASVQVVSSNTANTVQSQAAGSGNLSDTAGTVNGDSLTDALNQAQTELGDVDGDGESNATTPDNSGGGGSPAATFTVTETAGVVTFGGTASGNITVSWAGITGDSVATFTRGGITASETPDFEVGVAGTATTITLASGQALSLSAADASTLIANITALDGDGSIALTDSSLTVSAVITLDTAVTADIDASAASSLSGTGAEFDTAIAATGISFSGSYSATVTGTPAIADLNTIDADTSGVITATPATATLASLNALTGTGNAYTLVINDAGSVAAADLSTLDSKTTIAIDATSAATVSGSGTELTTALGSAGINTAAAVAVNATGSISSSQQAILDGATSGVITATLSNGDMTSLAGVANANGNNALTITITDSSVAAAALKSLADKTSVAVTATAVTTITGSGAQVIDLYDNASVNYSNSENISVSGTVSSSDAATITGYTGGTVTATVTAATAASLAADLGGLSGAYSLTVTGSNDPADLITLDTASSVTVDASGSTALSGTTANVLSVLSGDINLPADIAITLTDNPSVANANTIDAATTGVVTATLAADTLANLNGLNGSGNAYTLVINDAGTVAAADLSTLDSKTTVAINATSAATVSGTGTALATALGSAGINTAAGVALSVSDSISSTQLASLDGLGTGVITATISDGDLTSLANLTDDNGNNALSITVTDSSADAAALNTLDGLTSVAVTATTVNTVTGSAAAAVTALAASGSGLNLAADVAVTIDSGTATTAQQAALDGDTTGSITATIAENDLATLAGLADSNGNNALTVTVTDASVSASALNALDSKTSVQVTATAATTITGSGGDISTALTASGLNLSASIGVTPDAGTMTGAQLTSIEANTTGSIDLSAITAITLADLEVVNFAATSLDGRTLALNGTGDNGFEGATITLASGGASADLSGITIDTDDVAVGISGNTGDDTIIAPGSDTLIAAGAGSDTITGGAGADQIDLGAADGAVDTVIQGANDSADVGAISDSGFDGGAFADGDDIDITGADSIENFEDGTDLIQLVGAVSAATQDTTDPDGGVGSGEFTAIRGNFGGLFTVDTVAGNDMLILYDASGAGDIEMLYLPGAGSATITSADFSSVTDFTVTETAGVVEFGGSATGNITVAWSGTAGNSVASFSRGGVTASTTPDFSGTATTITVAAGQVLATDITELTAIAVTAGNTVDGSGSILLSDTTADAGTLDSVDSAVDATIDASNLSTLTGAASSAANVMTSIGITLDLDIDVTLAAGSVNATDLATVENNTTQIINMTAVTDVILAAADSVSFNGSTLTGETFNLTGTGNNGGESFFVNLAPGGQTVDLSSITVDEDDITVTVNGNDGNDSITATAADDVIVTNAGSDTVVFADSAANNGADTLSDFLSGSDKLDFSAFETAGATVEATGSLTSTAGTVYYLTGASAGDADSAAAVAAALSAAAAWTDDDATAWVLVSDDNSAAVYEWANTAVSADEVVSGELTLVGTITGTVAAGDLII